MCIRDRDTGVWFVGDLDANESVTLKIVVQVIKVGNITNNVNVTGTGHDLSLIHIQMCIRDSSRRDIGVTILKGNETGKVIFNWNNDVATLNVGELLACLFYTSIKTNGEVTCHFCWL